MNTLYEVTIWEKAEHWTFTVTVEAADTTAARVKASRQYSPKAYTIRDVRKA